MQRRRRVEYSIAAGACTVKPSEDRLDVQAPGRVLDLETTELLERAEQLSALAAALSDVAERRFGRLVLCMERRGSADGALRRFCAQTLESVRVLWATCDPLFTPRPLGPLLDIARLTDGELREQVEGGGQPWDVARALMDELERPSPSVVVVEDLHWADEATLDVLRLCARRVESVPALLVATYRDDSLHRSHPLRGMLGELPSGLSRRYELARLSRRAVATLAETSTLDSGELYERTGGNPFYVTEVLAAGSERIPPTIRDAVLARTAGLRGAASATCSRPSRSSRSGRRCGCSRRWCSGRWMVWTSAWSRGRCAARPTVSRSGMSWHAWRSRNAHAAPGRRAASWGAGGLAEPALGTPDLARLAHHAEAARDPAPCSGTRRSRPSTPRRSVRTAKLCTSTSARCGSRRESTPGSAWSCWSGSPPRAT